MKQLSRCHVFIASALAVVSLAGCNSAGMQSSGPAVNGQPLRYDLVGSSGEKKVGQYVWVWRTATVKVGEGYKTIEADCPSNYAVTGGGFRLQGGFVNASKPNDAFDGWVIVASSTGTSHDTTYAGCAPAK